MKALTVLALALFVSGCAAMTAPPPITPKGRMWSAFPGDSTSHRDLNPPKKPVPDTWNPGNTWSNPDAQEAK